jgi:hypothetical protein
MPKCPHFCHAAIAKADTARVVERTMLRYGGVRGDGGDDGFVLRAWLETVGGDAERLFCFFCKDRAKIET